MRISDWSSDVCSSDLGHDARSPLHDGNPVGIRRLGYENRSIAELFDVGGGADHTGLAGGDGSTDGGAGRDCGAFRFQAVMPEGGGAGLCLDRLGPGLDNVEFACLAVLGPLHIHRALIMVLDRASPAGELERSEEHTSELQSLMRISYAAFCLKNKPTESR